MNRNLPHTCDGYCSPLRQWFPTEILYCDFNSREKPFAINFTELQHHEYSEILSSNVGDLMQHVTNK